MMKKSQKKKRKMLVVIFFMILISIILIFLLKYYNNKTSLANGRDDYQTDEKEVIDYLEKRIIPRNMSEFKEKYNGNVSNDKLFISLNDLANYLENLKENKIDQMAEKEIKEYYEKNIDQIQKTFGKIGYKDFENALNYISNKNMDADNFSFAQIKLDTFLYVDNYFICDIGLVYDNFEIIVKTHLIKEKNNNINDIIFKIGAINE